MKDKTPHLLENLLSDSSFINWVKKRNKNDSSFWNLWIKNNPDKIDTVYTAKAIVEGIPFAKNEEISKEAIAKELQAVLGKINASKKRKKTIYKLLAPRVKNIMAVAAVGLVFVIVGSFLFNVSNKVTHRTGFGEIINLKLPDGSTVVLNGNSELTYDKSNPRDVVLEGEAYFKVKPKLTSHAKFWVNTNDLRVEVFGTKFNVNTRDKKTGVLLDEGSVSLKLKNGVSKKMIPGEYVSYSEEKEEIIHEKVEEATSFAIWREGTYIFKDVALKDVMKHMEHVYGIPSEFADASIENILLSGGIPNENLNICLTAIQKSIGIKIVQKDNTLYISKIN